MPMPVTSRPARRGFMIEAARAFIAVGSATALWPFVDHMYPKQATPVPQVKDVDLHPIRPGQTTFGPVEGHANLHPQSHACGGSHRPQDAGLRTARSVRPQRSAASERTSG